MSENSQLDPAEAVVTAVAAKEDTDPEALTPPLAETIDPDALNQLLRNASAESEAAVRFRYRGYKVVVDADADVELD